MSDPQLSRVTPALACLKGMTPSTGVCMSSIMVGRGLQVSGDTCCMDSEEHKSSGVGKHASGHAKGWVMPYLRTVSRARPCFLARAEAAR